MCMCVRWVWRPSSYFWRLRIDQSLRIFICKTVTTSGDRNTKKDEAGLFLTPCRSSAALGWTACPAQCLEIITVPSRSCWNISHDMNTEEWCFFYLKMVNLTVAAFIHPQVVFMDKERVNLIKKRDLKSRDSGCFRLLPVSVPAELTSSCGCIYTGQIAVR